MPRLKLYDDTLRDGEQMAGLAFSAAQKLQLARALAEAGIPLMQAGYPAASAGEAAACERLLLARRRGELPGDLELVLLARPLGQDLRACAQACGGAGVDPAAVSVLVLATVSEEHLRHKMGPRLLSAQGLDPRGAAQAPLEKLRRLALDLALQGVAEAKRLGFGLVELALEDASRADPTWLRVVALAGQDAGARRIAYCDTCGVLTPEKVRQSIPPLAAALGVEQGRAELVAHFHDDYGLAAVNTLEAALCGCTHLTVTLNGLGERCGNAALHRVVAPLRDLYGLSLPGFHYEKLRSLSSLAESISGELVPAHEAVVGRGAFRHESGLHVAALLDWPQSYQALEPASVGGQLELSFGKHSGQDGVALALGPEAGPRRVAAVTRRLKARAEALADSVRQRARIQALLRSRDRLDHDRCLDQAGVKALAITMQRPKSGPDKKIDDTPPRGTIFGLNPNSITGER